MPFFGRISLVMVACVALAALSGCSQGDGGQLDEEKEPHFVLGNSRYNEMDWPGAIEAFQESLEVNPHSAEAHYRLAMIYDTQSPDPAAAIYHYQQYLKLEPDAKNRDVINQRIHSCKVQLASDVCGLPDAPAFQKQMDSLVETNRQLLSQIDNLNAQLRQWSAYYVSLKAAQNAGGTPPNNSPAPATPAPTAFSTTPDDISPDSGTPAAAPQPKVTATAIAKNRLANSSKTVRPASAARFTGAHTHVVASGETMASIARKHGLTLFSMEEANPGVNPKKLHVGQLLNLPP